MDHVKRIVAVFSFGILALQFAAAFFKASAFDYFLYRSGFAVMVFEILSLLCFPFFFMLRGLAQVHWQSRGEAVMRLLIFVWFLGFPLLGALAIAGATGVWLLFLYFLLATLGKIFQNRKRDPEGKLAFDWAWWSFAMLACLLWLYLPMILPLPHLSSGRQNPGMRGGLWGERPETLAAFGTGYFLTLASYEIYFERLWKRIPVRRRA